MAATDHAGDEPSLEALLDRLAGWAPAPEDREAARLRVADVACAVRLGCTLPQWTPAGDAFCRLLGVAGGEQTAPGPRPPVGASTGGAAGALGAVLAACCRLTEVDDIELATCTTPGSVVVPAALAGAGSASSGGAGAPEAGAPDLLAAVAYGYEVLLGAAALLGGAYAPSVGTWPTRAVAAVAAAATAARAMGLPAEAGREAAALAAGVSSVGVAPEPARSWSLGMAVALGVGAAVAAGEGLRGDARLLARWPGGAYGPPPPGSVGRVEAVLGTGASAVRRSRLKPYAAARQVLAGSATLRALVEAGAVDPDDVAGVVLTVPAVHAAMVDRPALAVRLDTLASAQHQLAMAIEAPALLDELDHSLPPAPPVTARMTTIAVAPDPDDEAGAEFPARWGAALEVASHDGRRERHVAPAVPGEDRFGWAEVAAKATRLASANGVDPAEMEGILASVRQDDWSGLMGRLTAALGEVPATGCGHGPEPRGAP